MLFRSAEPTVRTLSPFVQESNSAPPTVAAPPPIQSEPRVRGPRAHSVDPGEVLVETETETGPRRHPERAAPRRRGLDRRKWPLWVGGGAFIASLITTIMLVGRPSERSTGAGPEPIELAPIPVEESTGAFRFAMSAGLRGMTSP